MTTWRRDCYGKLHPPETSPGDGWWLASDGVWYPPSPADQSESSVIWYRTNGWHRDCYGRWHAPGRPPGQGWWLASDEVWYPPSPSSSDGSRADRSSGVAGLGWLLMGFQVLVVMTDVVAEPDCDGTDLAEYQGCVRSFDLMMVMWQALVLGLAVAAVVRGIRDVHDQRRKISATLAASAILLCIAVLGWVFGVTGMWMPDRPFPYESLSAWAGSLIMATGAGLGLGLGLRRTRRRVSRRRLFG